jgi:organic hydroperoxide reductase OsmC/OhrA
MGDSHQFETVLRWPAEPGQSLPPDPAYSRNNVLGAAGKPDVAGSAPTVFGGDGARYNPEELLVLSLSQCHMLTYLAIAARRKFRIVSYEDRATGTLAVGEHGTRGKMSMQGVVLRPMVRIPKEVALDEARAIHDKAHANCFIANSVNFPVRIEPRFEVV